MPLPVTAIYIALLALIGLVLQQLVGRERLRTGVSLYDGGDERLAVALRRQGNFVEQVPVAMVLLAVVELNGASPLWLHALGGALVLARLVHPFGLDMHEAKVPTRFVGAAVTVVVIFLLIGTALWQVLARGPA
jgi:uncharacterized membrane protein YecN with MAPEG domain